MTNHVLTQIDAFVDATLKLAEASQMPLLIPYDREWLSPCYQKTGEQDAMVPWLPALQQKSCSFDNVEKALEMVLNEQYCLYFTHYFSNNLLARAPQGDCELLQVWNETDFSRLQENLIGHLLMKKRLKQPPTLFFGLTDDEDYILSVDNASGEVVLERVGKVPERSLAPDLATFLAELSPRLGVR
ncbi:SecY-interacting protein [Alteromonas pelagimontana]|uniref:Protein Syd n=1 Tax=Alteromonas pelagimontana TaxID=1858656 RepID=A0A6M4MF92_9ALTE|nr:SecY-interacting protein [Alteromonas pelagimontana]QJR81762.1 SecY-interacting protein [Alteromonas pelagimontana]